MTVFCEALYALIKNIITCTQDCLTHQEVKKHRSLKRGFRMMLQGPNGTPNAVT